MRFEEIFMKAVTVLKEEEVCKGQFSQLTAANRFAPGYI
jgi:hypothetical protein